MAVSVARWRYLSRYRYWQRHFLSIRINNATQTPIFRLISVWIPWYLKLFFAFVSSISSPISASALEIDPCHKDRYGDPSLQRPDRTVEERTLRLLEMSSSERSHIKSETVLTRTHHIRSGVSMSLAAKARSITQQYCSMSTFSKTPNGFRRKILQWCRNKAANGSHTDLITRHRLDINASCYMMSRQYLIGAISIANR